MWYFVEYNCKYVAQYKSVQGCINYIRRKGYKDDSFNTLYIVDENGEVYNNKNGEIIREKYHIYNEELGYMDYTPYYSLGEAIQATSGKCRNYGVLQYDRYGVLVKRYTSDELLTIKI